MNRDGGNEQVIRERAYAIWQSQGCPDGRELDHWLAAEHELGAAGGRKASPAARKRAAATPKRKAAPKGKIQGKLRTRAIEEPSGR